ncbi:MAG: translocation/assembly module TamB domain-containing protein [Wenzhouxiangellaceae bacterium]|nr:translocation/assembly module TamB domain-containing protein [Wenzhouxiangellaceae bacterium]
MKRLLIITASVVVVLALLLAIGWLWLTTSTAGAAFLLARAEGAVPGLSLEHRRGGLDDGVVLADLRYQADALTVEADAVELAVNIRLLARTLTIERLQINGVRVALPPASTEPASEAPLELGDYRLPLTVVIKQLEITDLQIADANGEPVLAVERAALAARAHERLTIERFELVMDELEAGLNGTLGLAEPWPAALALQTTLALDADTAQQVELDVNGPLEQLAIKLRTRGPAALDGTATITGLPTIDALDGEIELAGVLDGWPAVDGRIEELSLRASGGLAAWQLATNATLHWPELPSARLEVNVDGDPERIALTTLRIETLDGAIDGQAEAHLGDPLTATANLALNALNPSPVLPDWPAGARLNGTLAADWDGERVRLAPLQLSAPPSELSLSGSAEFAPASEALAVDLQWQSLAWPPLPEADTEPLFSSRTGTLKASGTLTEWQAELQAWLELAGQPPGEIGLNATGDASGIELESGRLDFAEFGSAALSGRYDHAASAGDPAAVALNLQLENLDPSAFVTELPGRVDADITLAAVLTDPLKARIEIDTLGGQLRQVPLSGSGSAALVGARLAEGRLDLALGDNRVRLESDDGERWQLALAAERLDQLWPDLTGRLLLDADVQPMIQEAGWQIEANGLAWQDIRLAALRGAGTAGWGDTPTIDASLVAEDVDLNPWERLASVNLQLTGTCTAHALELAVDGSRLDLDLAIDGALTGCLEAPQGWLGQVESLALSDTPWGRWQLEQAMPVEILADSTTAGPGCLWTETNPGRLCLSDFASAGPTGQVELALNALPLDLLLLITDPVVTFGSDIRGLAKIDWDAEGIRAVDSTLLLGPGQMRMLGDDEVLLNIRGANFATRSPEPGALNAQLELALEQKSTVTATVQVPDINTPRELELDSRIDLDLPRLAAFNRLVPQLDELGGGLGAYLELSGPLSALDYHGELALRDARILYAPLGMNLSEFALTVEIEPERGQLRGGFMAGPGRGQIEGQIERHNGDWQGTAQINGEKLQLFDVDWLRLTASSDLSLAFTPEQLKLGGGLVIDRARLGMPPGSETRVAVSEDEVIIGEDTKEDEDAPPAAARVLAGQVRLEMGPDVKLSAAGMETRLTGALEISWPEDSDQPIGRGMIQLVDGSYRAYGQSLEVTEGDVLFTDQPIDNPVLEIEAVREIFGDPQVEQAGVRIAGPAQRPQITLFTDPPTTSEKALTYILTGADFDHAGGQGAFNVGLWVLPRLFVSYGIGLFDTGNVLAARYELSRRWGLRATSGERDTGMDLSFIIDR